MSNSEPAATCALQINLIPPEGADSQDIQLVVYDALDNPVFQGEGGAALTLPPGLYTVRWSYAGRLEEQVVRLPQVQLLNWHVKRSTPAPVPDSLDTHEYYSAYNGDIYNDMNTGETLGQPGLLNSRLYILLRPHSAMEYRGEDIAAGLRLLDANLLPLFELGARSRRENSGLLLCTLLAQSGAYYLEYREPSEGPFNPAVGSRLFPIQLFPGWQTRLFLFSEKGRPNFSSASLSLLRMDYQGSYSSERRRADAAADMALSSLQNNTPSLPKEIERGLLSGKFDNPLLGLLAAHFVLQHPDSSQTNPSEEARLRDLTQQLFINLDDLLPQSPDVLALRYKAALRFSGDERFPDPTAQPKHAPLLRASLDALLQAESRGLSVIEEGGLIELLAPNLYYDSPWASYRPPVQPDDSWEEGSLEIFNMGIKSPLATPPEGEPWMLDTVKQALEMTSVTGREPDWNHLAASLGIPPRKMKRMVDTMR
jgi:hypothetical protein